MTAVHAVPAGESDGGKYRRSELAVAFLQHLADLRAAVVKSLAALMVGVAVAIPLAPYVLDLLKHPLVQAGKEPDAFLRTLEVSGGMTVLMHMSFWTGLLLSMPCILYFAAQYVFPGLTRRERRLLRWVFAPAAILFVAGVVEGYFITLPVGLQILFAISNWLGAPLEFVDLSHYVLYTLKLLLGFGCAFEFPLAVLALGAAGIVTAAQLRDKRRHVIVGVTALAMLLSPPDPYTWFFIAAPILVLQEGCIAIIQTLERRRTAPQQGVQP